ncbi:hypothetical protein LINGRAHAP2_LOCUS25094 [Linum grandiflorum]
MGERIGSLACDS